MGELANRVKAARAYAGEMTQQELAGRLPFSLSTLQRTEAGGRAVGELELPAFVKHVAEATGLPQWFFTMDLDAIDPTDGPSDEDLSRLERQLQVVQRKLEEAHRSTKSDLEKLTRGVANDRGKLRQMEAQLGQLVVLLKRYVDGDTE